MSSTTRVLRSQAATLPVPPEVPEPSRLTTEAPSSTLETAEAHTSRPPSPRREEIPSQGLALENPRTVVSENPPQYEEDLDPDELRASTDMEDNTSDDEEAEEGVHSDRASQRAHSLDSARKRLRNKRIVYLPKLTTEQVGAVREATKLMTPEQKNRVSRRQDKVLAQNNEAGHSRDKGKTIDPREWGNAGIDPKELDIRAQEQAIKVYKKNRGNAKRGKNLKRPKDRNEETRDPDESDDEEDFEAPVASKAKGETPVDRGRSLEIRRASSRPAAQIVPDSSLGIALGNVAKLVGNSGDPDEPSSPSDDDSNDGYSTSSRSRSSIRSRHHRSHK